MIIPTRVNANVPVEISKNDLQSIVYWFEKHQRSFYVLGWSYLRNRQQLEELFYKTILKVNKDLPKVKSRTSFDAMVTTIFIHMCRELADGFGLDAPEESGQHDKLFNGLGQLTGQLREALVFTYMKGLSIEETADLLQVSNEQMKELLVSGVQSLRLALGYGEHFNGCREYQQNYWDYLERNLERPQKIDFEKHIYHCRNCQEDLASFQDVILQLTDAMEEFQVPAGFMESIMERVAETEKHRQQKNSKRNRIAFIAASVFALVMCTGFFTGAFAQVYYSWTEEDPDLRAFLQEGLGERLNLEAESNGVKIRIKSVIADDVQTLIFYEIEDTKDNGQFMINFDDGVYVEDEWKIMNDQVYPPYQPPDPDSALNREKPNVYHGKISLRPLKEDSTTIKLKISKMMRLFGESTVSNENMENEKTGDWNLKIPVTKQPSTEYTMDEEMEIEGVPIQFEKLILAPTATILQYNMGFEPTGKKRIDSLEFDSLEVNQKKLKADLYGGSSLDSYSFQAQFEPLFEKKAKEVKFKLSRLYLSVDDIKSIPLDPSKEYPQTFEYAGSTISIDKVEIGQPTTVVISNHEIKNRAYESFHYNITTEEKENISMEMDSEGVLVDKDGKEYDRDNITSEIYEKLEKPRHFSTVETIKIQGDRLTPKALDIFGYSTTKYLDDVVSVKLD